MIAAVPSIFWQRFADATLDAGAAGPRRTLQMPALWLSIEQVVQALARTYGADRLALVRYEPQDWVQRLFAAFPPLAASRAEALGFAHDGSAEGLVRRAMPAGWQAL